MLVGTSATWHCHEQCWGSHTFVALPNCLQWHSSSQPPWTWAKGVGSRRIVRNETYQIYSKPWTSNGPNTIHYLLNESCKPKCSWGISNSRLWPERPITQQLTIAMIGKLRSSEQVWDSLSRPVPPVYNLISIKYSKDPKRLWLHRRTQRLEITSDISISNRKSRHLHRVQGKMFLDKILPENEWESVQHDQKNKKQATSPRLSLCCIPCSSSLWITCSTWLSARVAAAHVKLCKRLRAQTGGTNLKGFADTNGAKSGWNVWSCTSS